MTNAIEATKASSNPAQGLYNFVREHVLIANSVTAASATVVALLDFFAPRLSLLPRLVYTATALIVALIIVAALFPVGTGAALRAIGFGAGRKDASLWRRPVWQFSVALLLAVTALGFISVAKAERGGALASSFDGVRSAQASVLGLERATATIQSGVDTANQKLDRIAATIDPENTADKCPDIDCAVQNGASPKVIEKMLAKGEKLPAGIYVAGYLRQLALKDSRNRFAIFDLYRERGLEESLFEPHSAEIPELRAFDRRLLSDTKHAAPPSRQTGSTTDKAWSMFLVCVAKTHGGVTLGQLALIQRDIELYRSLRSKGAKQNELRCDWSKYYAEMKGESVVEEAELERAVVEAAGSATPQASPPR